MQGVYDLLSSEPDYNDFKDIIDYANSIGEWRDLKSGMALLSKGLIPCKALNVISECISEKDLAEFVNKGVVPDELLQQILSDKTIWNDWKSAEQIIIRHPESLKCTCLRNIASRQPDEVILCLREDYGVANEIVRGVVIEKGTIDDWDSALSLLSRDIVRSSDSFFKRIAVQQSCEELFGLYEREFIEEEDMKDIVIQMGYWDDVDSLDKLSQSGLLIAPKEQIILATLSKGYSIEHRLIEDNTLLKRVIAFWEHHQSCCPDFPSLCWDALVANFTITNRDRQVASNHFSNQIDQITSFQDVESLKCYLLKEYLHHGQDYFYSLIDGLAQGSLFSHGFVEGYSLLIKATNYVPLKEIADFKEKYKKDLLIVHAIEGIGLISTLDHGVMESIVEDMALDDAEFAQKYNDKFFEYVENNPDILGRFKNSFMSLNDEQRRAVLTDDESVLVNSSAGSGKTRVIVSKYEYLTQTKGIDKDSIRILAYTKATRKEINNERLGLDPEKGPARTFHSFANEIIKMSGVIPDYLKDVQEGANGDGPDHSPRAAMLYNIMVNDGIENDVTFMEAMASYAMSYRCKDPNKNLSFYTDRNGQIGSLKSYQERIIFDFLADNSVDFAYEERSLDGVASPDFTIYHDDKLIYYEHFAIDKSISFSPFGDKYLADAKRKMEQWGTNLIFTTGAGIHDPDDIIEQLKTKLIALGIPLIPISRDKKIAILKEKEDYVEIFQSGIKMCLDVFDIIRESLVPMDEVHERCVGNEFARSFMMNMYDRVIAYYMKLLGNGSNRKVDYTGCIEYALDLCRCGKIKTIPWTYILIDEYQDISRLRFEFIKSLRLIKPSLHICAVGDDWQSIYSFANSDLRRFKGFESDWPNAKTLIMAQTFRFNNPLLAVSSTFLRKGEDPQLVDKVVIASNHAPKYSYIESIERNDFVHQINTIKKIISDKQIEPDCCLILARYQSDLKFIKSRYFNGRMWGRYQHCFMTMHSSKGLTREYVFIVNCNANTLPSQVRDNVVIKLIRNSDSNDKYYEERRLFYVAITRASVKTFVLYSGTPSEFIKEIDVLLAD